MLRNSCLGRILRFSQVRVARFVEVTSQKESASISPASNLLSSFISPCNTFAESGKTLLHHSLTPAQLPTRVQRARTFATNSVTRDLSFGLLHEEDLSFFRSVVGKNGVVVDPDALEVANKDWMGKYFGNSKLMLLPKTTSQVSRVLKHCNERRLAVVPQGGNTGLVGGSVPVFDEVILNLGAMNSIISFDEVSGIVVCEAGCILESVHSFLATKQHGMPLDLGAKGSCQVGGNVSTNAGGLRLLRYGSLHANVLGLEVVLADGTVLDLLSTLRKDNTGFDLKHLFIGGEGALGVVTKVSMLAAARSSSVQLAFLSCPDYAAVQATLVEAKQQLGEILSAFEFMDRHVFQMVMKHLDGCKDPLPNTDGPFYLLVETSGSNEAHDREKLDQLLERVMAEGLVHDGTIAQDHSQAASLWRIREGCAEALQKAGAVYKYDLSLPVRDLYSLVEVMRRRLDGIATVTAWGHLGDGNLHLNISCPAYSDAVRDLIEPFVYEWTAEKRGSISAEHGIGLMKANALHYSKSPASIQVMAGLKALLDPNGILNPYKVLPPQEASAAAGSAPQHHPPR